MQRYILTSEKDVRPIIHGVTYAGGNFINERFGPVHIDGTIYLCMDEKEYPHVDVDKFEEMKEWVAQWTNDYLSTFMSPKHPYYQKYLQGVENCLYLVPSLRWPTTECKTFLQFNAIFWYVDDFLVSSKFFTHIFTILSIGY